MTKGTDYVGVTVNFFCHDGAGNFVLHRRNDKCRDEHYCWDTGSGGLRHGETLEECVRREVQEEYGVEPEEVVLMGYDEVFREHEGKPTHWIAFRYKARVNQDDVINNEPHKHDKIAWFTLDALPNPLHSQLPKAITKYREILAKT